MIRAILYALISIVAITFVRMVVGIIMKGMGDLMREESASAAGAGASSSSGGTAAGKKTMPTSGEFKACAQCGTYVLATSALTLAGRDGTRYYCSPTCRDLQKV
jgi:hypothetical protein